jgi:hypothetical protein
MTGIMASRSQDDERLLSEIGKLTPNSDKNQVNLVIYDARSYLNALANKVMSGGFENTRDYYKDCEIIFCDIDNIHAVRDAFTRVYDLAHSTST